MKKIFCYLLIAALVLGVFAGCKKQDTSPTESTGVSQTENTEAKQTQNTETTQSETTETTANIATEDTTNQTPTYASGLYISETDVDMQGEQLFTAAILDTIDWEAIVNKIPATYYEPYPNLYDYAYLNGEPLSATLYKDGKVEKLSPYDPRVVRLVNFYHNTLHYTTYASGWTGLHNEAIEENEKTGFKLVLTYPPEKHNTLATHYTVTIYNKEIIGIHCSTDDSVNIGGVVHAPLHTPYNWLTVFGF